MISIPTSDDLNPVQLSGVPVSEISDPNAYEAWIDYRMVAEELVG